MPALSLLAHGVRAAAPDLAALLDTDPREAILVDARTGLDTARRLCRLLATTGTGVPVLAVLSEAGLVAVSSEWAVHDFLLADAGPAEIDARLRLLPASPATDPSAMGVALVVGELVIDEATYTARLRGRALELTYKEFGLLKYLATHPGQVCSRAHLLEQIWGDDYVGGARTVDVHVRRLRAKLGLEHEQLIATVRNLGYKLVRPGA